MIKKLRFSARRMSLVLTIGFLVLSAFACGGGGGSSSGSSDGGGGGGGTTPPPATSPNISLSTQQLLFGNVIPNSVVSSSDRSVTVTNTGTANLVMGQIDPAALIAPFEILNDNCSGTSVAPSGSCTVRVRFKPTVISSDTYTDSFAVTSNDPDQPSLTVNLSGDAKGLNVVINKVDTSAVSATGGLVRLLVSVTGGDNKPIDGLGKDDFSLSEGGTSQPIINLNSALSPVSASLVLDYSYSVLAVQNDIETSATLFLNSLNPLSDEANVIKFASEVREAIGFTPISNITALQNAIVAPYTDPTNATKLFDAVVLATDKLMVRLADNRRCAIVVSDGEDIINSGPASTADLDDVIADALDNKVFVFTIGLGNPIITDVLQRMAFETGGQYFETPDSAELNTIYAQITQILNGQYEITFTTAKADGSLNSLRVIATQPAVIPPLTGEDTESVTY